MTPKYNRFDSTKIMLHADRVREIAAGRIPMPVEWVIYPSNVCGYKCAHCIMAREQIDHRNTLSPQTMAKIPDDARRLGIKCVIFSGGGDPLLNKMTPWAASKLKEYGVMVGLNNQGFLLDDPEPYDFIRYSVDAGTPETYKKIHGVDGWDRVNRNIERHKRSREMGKKIEMGLAFLITPWNWKEVEQFIAWAQNYKPDFIHLRPAFLDREYMEKQYPGGGKELKEVIIPALREVAKKAEASNDNVYFRVDKFEGFWTPKMYSKCRATPIMAVTSGDGAFLVCQDRGISADENYLRWGNYNEQSFEQIWGSDAHKKVLESIDLPKCPRCVENGYNEIIEHVFMNDGLKANLL